MSLIKVNDIQTTAGVPNRGKVLQVVQASTTAVFSTTSTSFVDITGLSASITPSSTSSKILIMCTLYRGTSSAVITNFRFTRAGSALFVGDAAGTKIQSTGANYVGNSDNQAHICVVQMNYLDSPSTTSSTTYAAQMRTQGGETVFVGRTGGDSDGVAYPRLPASIILMEVSG